VRPDDEETRCELLLSLGEPETRAGETQSAKEVFSEAAAIACRLALPQALARAAYGYGGRIVWVRGGDDERLVPLLEEALAALPADEVELRSRLRARLAGPLRDEHSRKRREALSAEALELERASGDPAVVAYALEATAYSPKGDWTKRSGWPSRGSSSAGTRSHKPASRSTHANVMPRAT
jgi:hypothetical protein